MKLICYIVGIAHMLIGLFGLFIGILGLWTTIIEGDSVLSSIICIVGGCILVAFAIWVFVMTSRGAW